MVSNFIITIRKQSLLKITVCLLNMIPLEVKIILSTNNDILNICNQSSKAGGFQKWKLITTILVNICKLCLQEELGYASAKFVFKFLFKDL